MGNVVPSVTNAEHIGSNTGDNIEAKRTAPYGWNGTTWQRQPATSAGFITSPYDYKALAQTSTTDVWTYKSGGAGGTLVATKTITYTDATKSVISTIVRT